MKYLKLLSEKRVFNYEYVLKITGTRFLADRTIQNYLKKDYIKRVKKNLYVTMSLENDGVIPSKYEIASAITKSSYVSHHSAIEYYGYSNQVYTEVTVSSLEYFKDFIFNQDKYVYKRSTSNKFVESTNRVSVSSLAMTIVDCIDDIKTYDDFEEVTYNLSSIPAVSQEKILAYLEHKDKKILFNKVGLLLSFFKDDFMLDDDFFIKIKKSGITGVKYYTKEKNRLTKYYKEWKLYCYDIDEILQVV